MVVRPTASGAPRYRVEYRLGGREARTRYGGSFRTKREALARRRWLESELAAMRTPDLGALKAEAPNAPTLAEAASTLAGEPRRRVRRNPRPAPCRARSCPPDPRRPVVWTRSTPDDVVGARDHARARRGASARRSRRSITLPRLRARATRASIPNPAKDERVGCPTRRRRRSSPRRRPTSRRSTSASRRSTGCRSSSSTGRGLASPRSRR